LRRIRPFFWRQDDEAIEVQRGAGDVSPPAGREWDARLGRVPSARRARGDVLRVEEDIRPPRCKRAPAAAAVGRRKQSPQTARRRPHARQSHPAGGSPKKPVTPTRHRARAVWIRETFQIDVRRARRLAGFGRASWHRSSRAKDQWALWRRIREIGIARPRSGYLRIHILLRRQGWHVK
jgi:hypothetical protein